VSSSPVKFVFEAVHYFLGIDFRLVDDLLKVSVLPSRLHAEGAIVARQEETRAQEEDQRKNQEPHD